MVSSTVNPGVVLVLTTIGADTDGAALARTLVEERLAACVNVLPPMTSVYRWEGRVQTDREQQLIIKTTDDQLPALQSRLPALHPYDLPEFLVLRVSGGSDGYLTWVGESTRLTN
jgi:periplasmic divalent cation tolerance protein